MSDVLERPATMHAAEDWYTRTFGDLYPLVYQHRDDASARIEAESAVKLLGLTPPQRVLDVCCGAGRHLQPLLSLGFRAVGIDLSPCLLELAASRRGLTRQLVRADIRALPFDHAFHAALNFFTSFGYFLDESQNVLAIRQMSRTLVPGGKLLMDLVHRRRLEATLVPHSRRTIDGHVVENHRRIDHNRVLNQTIVTAPDGSQRSCIENVRLYHPEELEPMLHDAGLTDVRFFGSLDGDALAADSPRLIVTGVRR